MVKFSKRFERQMVPEWKEAFVDYGQLKKDLKKMIIHGEDAENKPFNDRVLWSLRKWRRKREHAIIDVHRRFCEGEFYETEMQGSLAASEGVVEFFAHLDFQLNKVNRFYRTKEKEFVERGDALKRQLEILLLLKDEAISYVLRDELGIQTSIKCDPDGNNLRIDRRMLHCAEKMIRGAFVELYKGLGHLENYRNLNMLAFAKILKKFEKATSKQVLPVYLGVVERSYFNTSNKVLKISDEVEELFVKSFSENDRRKAMKYLKPATKKESHAAIFFTGLFTGCFLALLVGYSIMAGITGTYRAESDVMYMETVFPVLSMFSLIFLHLFLYGCNIVMWRKVEINYSFIFELSPSEELKQGDVFLICATSMVAVIGVLFIHLTLVAKGFSFARAQAIPGFLLLSFVVVLVCPFNIIYKSSRYRFLSVIRNIILAPLYKVVMLDFFMADQLCSQVPMLREMEYVACYFITGSYKTEDYQYCMSTTYYRDLAYAVSFLPYYWRAMQCARRWFDEGDTSHLTNLGKYVSAMLAAGAKVAYDRERGSGWLYLVVVMSSVATMYQLYWDFVKDWGLLRLRSKNRLLRDELMLRHKFIYFVSMGLNLILRLAWLQTVFHFKFEKVDYRVTMVFLAALEVVRRGQWNFYRLENEHLNNADKFRAVKTVPLPFHEVDEQD
ncbi:phosphate transporter PHO1-3-like isoform X2 [Andrographis paniculata]|uniref:phosphate transporter PHO1-3-like isoform X2 n=1 Tax=Andrographis paniculata TaxID=175694 RepID=UPI0021E734C2|nr:phosphate transporter PHO1-3-like isoform X2 [Andrographis paniculata]